MPFLRDEVLDRLRTAALVLVLGVPVLMGGCTSAPPKVSDWRQDIRSDKRLLRLQAVMFASRAPAREAVPALIERLEDVDDVVRSMAYEALVRKTGQDIAFDPIGDPFERKEAVEMWRGWWRRQSDASQEPGVQSAPASGGETES